MNMYGVDYIKPKVYLLAESGLGVAEFAGRTAYDSFENSENGSVKGLNFYLNEKNQQPNDVIQHAIDDVNAISSSELLDSLAWVHHHHSVIEHATVSYIIKGTSRGVLQEHARHRLQAITVRSTRYTMQDILNIFIASQVHTEPHEPFFINEIKKLDMFVIAGKMLDLEIRQMYDKLYLHMKTIGYTAFKELALSKDAQAKKAEQALWKKDELLKVLSSAKKKRNVGDAFKYIVSDNWKVDLVVTFNLRSLKNYFDLRDSGAAYFQIQWLAEAMKEVTPVKYLRLIDKKYKEI